MPGLVAQINNYAGVELNIRPDNSFSARRCLIALKGNLLTIESTTAVDGGMAEVLKPLGEDRKVGLALTGKGILIKRTSRVEEVNAENLHQIFPNLALEDFYIQNFKSGRHSFIALVRKEVADQIVSAFVQAGCKVLFISLGPFVVSHVLSQINSYGNELIADGHTINFDEEFHWEDYKYQPGLQAGFPLKIDIHPIEPRYLLAYSAAFQFALFSQLDPVLIYTPQTETFLQDYVEEKKFKVRLIYSLSIIFILLFVNFLVFSWVDNENQGLLANANQSSAAIGNVRNIRVQLEERKKQLDELAWNKGIPYSFICDELAKSLPGEITLEQLLINPQQSSSSSIGLKEVYMKGQIVVKGKSSSLSAVNNWIYALKSRDWVKKIEIDNYSSSDQEDEDNRQGFTFRVYY